MDTTLSEEEVMVRETARKFLEARCPTKLVRAMEKDEAGFPADLWREAAELGWQGLALPEQYGGSGLPMTYLGLVMHEVGRALAPLPLLSTVSAVAFIRTVSGRNRGSRSVKAQVRTVSPETTLGRISWHSAASPCAARVSAADTVLSSGNGASARPTSCITRPR